MTGRALYRKLLRYVQLLPKEAQGYYSAYIREVNVFIIVKLIHPLRYYHRSTGILLIDI